jgi:NAD(P)-dependent dehydrogenase (short-subunit alcohol dehydrogenase family)
MNIHNSVAFVTSANRGIGKAFVKALVRAGVRSIYATARSIESLTDVMAISLDRIMPTIVTVESRAIH